MLVGAARRGVGTRIDYPFSTMLEVIDFDLDNCYVITYDGRLLKQARGIPMGSALSPPLAIGTLAWMEHEWMQTLDDDAKARFRNYETLHGRCDHGDCEGR